MIFNQITSQSDLWAYLFYALIVLFLAVVFLLAQREKLRRERLELTKEREVNEKLRQADRLKDEFLAKVAYELRNPLNGIIGLGEALFDRLKDDASSDTRKDLVTLIRAGRRLSTLVNDIHDYARLRDQSVKLQLKPVDLHSLTEIVIDLNHPYAKAKKIELVNEIPPDFPHSIGDEDRLLQIFHNLVGNALKFTKEGKVRIRGEAREDGLYLGVCDTGPGIPDKERKHLFQAFEDKEGAMARSFDETGLGLDLAQELVRLHGGEMWVESKEGEGTTFFFRLPMSKEKAELPAQKELLALVEIAPKPVEPGAIKILVVDDDPIHQQVLHNHLSREGYHIISEFNGEDAWQRFEANERFDMVLLDLTLPGLSGFELCRRIRERYLASQLPVIMITSNAQVHDVVAGFNFGANDYLTKPFSKQEFLARIRTHLNLVHINAAYGRFVPHEFLRSLGKESIMEVQLGDQVEKEVTVLFADIRAYTSLAETMKPEDNFNFLNGYLGRLGPIIKRHHGIVNQYYGDGIMALFQRKPSDAIAAAIDIHQKLLAYNQERIAKGRKPIRTGVGLHTGPLMLGIIGDEERMDAAVVSDTVNTAARMEGLNKVYGANIIASEPTLAALEDPDGAHFRFLAMVKVKGKKDTLTVYEFFAGDDPEEADLKKQTLGHYERGIDAYFKREFARASDYFKMVLTLNPKDRIAKHYLLNCTKYMIQGVSPSWNGVEEMTKK